MQINSHILKLSGRSELPQEIEPGHNYHVSLEGSIPSYSVHDNEDGTWNKIYTFKPVKIELLDPKGKTLKLKDTRQKSQLWRGAVWKVWNRGKSELNADDFYDRLMNNLIQHSEEVIEMFGETKQ